MRYDLGARTFGDLPIEIRITKRRKRMERLSLLLIDFIILKREI